MDDLLKGLLNLGVGLPSTDQVVELLESDIKSTQSLAQLLALTTSSAEKDDNNHNNPSSAVDLMGAELLTDAVNAILTNFKSSIDGAKAAFQREEAQLDKPTKVKAIPRKAQLSKHEAALTRMRNMSALAGHDRTRLVFDGGKSHCSSGRLAQMRRIEVDEMTLVPKAYRDAYLVVRLIAQPISYQGVQLLGEDPKGDLISIAISHVSCTPLTAHEASCNFPTGTLLAVKEPFLSMDHTVRAVPSKPGIGVRVDSPTDIIFLSGEDEALRDVQWATPPSSKPAVALDHRISWLRDPPLAAWLANGAPSPAPYFSSQEILHLLETLLVFSRPGAAWRELCGARKAGLVDDRAKDAMEIEGRIRYLCEDFLGAADAFGESRRGALSSQSALRKHSPPAVDEASSEKSRSQAARQASLQKDPPSSSEISSLYFAASSGARKLDARTYIGPVEVRDIPGAGRGLILTEDVEPGRIILLCRAVEPQYPSATQCVRVNLEMGLVSTTSQIRAQTALIHALVDRPELQLPVLGLTAGPSVPYSEWVRLPYPLHLPRAPTVEQAESYERPSIDAAYVDGVLRFNAFGPSPPSACTRFSSNLSSTSTSSSQPRRPLEDGRRTMPHPLPALLNHSCYPNVSTTFHGDVLLSRALRRLKAGTEVLHQYVQGEQAHAVRKAQLSKHDFQCACYLCNLDMSDTPENRSERARIVAGELPAVLERSRVVLKMRQEPSKPDDREIEAHQDVAEALEGFAKRIDETYAEHRGDVRPDLFDVFHSRAAHLAIYDQSAAIQCELSALRSVGAIVAVETGPNSQHALSQLPALHLDRALTAMLHISRLFAQLTQPTQSKSWARTAAWAHECIIGGGLRVLQDRFGSLWNDVIRLCDGDEEAIST
ncbi:Predicted histone tail methylase containing SET domain [Ceraceosorus bombacis]|uniref:Predicted histone tail methylase containing SET domain n=1 Tax=Ceraceosorus bombacis TaxID=401625 RepID=A0A0N7LA43_9BASI|nr:Predicted histone tail methylase containing SET domain [Ceraceosorus bombacis]